MYITFINLLQGKIELPLVVNYFIISEQASSKISKHICPIGIDTLIVLFGNEYVASLSVT